MKEKIPTWRAYLAWSNLALFYCYQNMLRVIPGVMETHIREALSINADSFGTLGSFYLYTYALMQIPVGLAIDRFGIRRTAMTSVFLCIIGTYIFYIADTLWMAQLSRALTGAGSVCAFMSALKIAADYLPAGRRALMMGLTLSMGAIGAITAGKPLVLFAENFSWRTAILITAALGIFVLFMIRILVPQKKEPHPDYIPSHSESLWPHLKQEFKAIASNKYITIYALLTIGLYAPLTALSDLWGTSYLVQKFNFPQADAAHIIMYLYVGLTIGCSFIPWLFEKFHRINLGIQLGTFSILACFATLLYAPFQNPLLLIALLIVIGICASTEMLCFTGALVYSNPKNSGMIIGFVNMINMIGGALLQQSIGHALDYFWSGNLSVSGIRLYHIQEYTSALTVIIVILGLCCALVLKLHSRKHKKLEYEAQTH